MGEFSIWHWLIVAVILFVSLGGLRLFSRSWVAPSHGLNTNWALEAVSRGRGDTFSRAEVLRDDLKKRLLQAAPEGVSITAYESPRGHGAVWLRLELVRARAQRSDLSMRTVVALDIARMDFHRFEHLLNLSVGRGRYRRELKGLVELRDEDVAALMRFASGHVVQFPWLQSRRQRDHWWQLWRPKNRVVGVRHDWAFIATNVLGLAALLYGAIHTFAEDAFGTHPIILGPAALALGVATLILGNLLLRRRVTSILNAGKPLADPRTLIRMDSWQVTLTGLGARQSEVQAEVLRRLADRRPPGVQLQPEWIGYASVDGRVEREQHVLTFRQAIAFLRLESYGEDLYVGWDSHLNAGVWVERDVAQGVDRRSGTPVIARSVVQGWRTPNEYDLGDASFLTEWLHACVVAVVKQQLAEHRIDQEIDFTVQRESRADAMRSTDPNARKQSRFGLGALRRVG